MVCTEQRRFLAQPQFLTRKLFADWPSDEIWISGAGRMNRIIQFTTDYWTKINDKWRIGNWFWEWFENDYSFKRKCWRFLARPQFLTRKLFANWL